LHDLRPIGDVEGLGLLDSIVESLLVMFLNGYEHFVNQVVHGGIVR